MREGNIRAVDAGVLPEAGAGLARSGAPVGEEGGALAVNRNNPNALTELQARALADQAVAHWANRGAADVSARLLLTTGGWTWRMHGLGKDLLPLRWVPGVRRVA